MRPARAAQQHPRWRGPSSSTPKSRPCARPQTRSFRCYVHRILAFLRGPSGSLWMGRVRLSNLKSCPQAEKCHDCRRKAAVLTELPQKTKRRVPMSCQGKPPRSLAVHEHLRKMGGAILLKDSKHPPVTAKPSVRNEHRRALMQAFQLTGRRTERGQGISNNFCSDPEDKVIILRIISRCSWHREGLASHPR